MGIRLYITFDTAENEAEFENYYLYHLTGENPDMEEIRSLISEYEAVTPGDFERGYLAYKNLAKHEQANALHQLRLYGFGKGFELPPSLDDVRYEYGHSTNDRGHVAWIIEHNESLRKLPLHCQLLISGFHWG